MKFCKLNNLVLPTVYEDELSYYEEICKLKNKINEINNFIINNMSELLDSYFNSIMINAIYEKDNEIIILKREEIKSYGDVHSYNINNNTMSIN